MNFTPTKSQKSSGKSKGFIWAGLAVLAIALGVGYYFLFGLSANGKGANTLVLGHAGSGFFSPLFPFNPLPPNSMASIVEAIEDDGADGVEVDVQLSKDGVPILYHDVDLESMTEKQGKIEDLPASEVVGLRYTGGFVYELFHDEKIITLEALLQRFSTYGTFPHLHIDLRNHNPARHQYYAQTLMALLNKYKVPQEKLVFISPNPDFLEAFREVEPRSTLMIDTGGNFEEALQQILEHNFDGVCANGKEVTEAQVQEARQHNLQVVLFGGKSRSRIAKMLSLEPDAIQVNNVETMRSMVD
ncbi:glycerophosphodiester phosphodiesterase [Pontibacter harenae]|uniref:glycerophosphodiester phosphodiesterase n=1 Tax=Pontibacter harenae TaxID=2894083 RepID=UPI001E43B784|nr:glycerophosphodiester phosphodiesterase family protein [Pontibacter harenae]MCC9166719.1 glycerophosphodiester phosphodiesterase [Pontibacter harenae]